MNTRFKLVHQNRYKTAQEAFENSVHKYLDEREKHLFDDVELDLEIFREVGALYRVVRYMIDSKGVGPMPEIIQRMFYLKRDIYQSHRGIIERKQYSSRIHIKRSR